PAMPVPAAGLEDTSMPPGDGSAGNAPAGAGRAVAADADAAMIAALNPAPGGIERIELARAYLDLGDTGTARDLLREVADGGDPAARAEASRLLEGIA
ncbi:MAG TPA: FimV/HubP family polar landmark protein, partial [Luteimonas sp.]